MIFYLKHSRGNCSNSLRLAVVKSLWLIQEQSFTQQQDSAQSCGYRTRLTSAKNWIYSTTGEFWPSSLAWERNFSVLNRGFFSSSIRFQKDASFASEDTEEHEDKRLQHETQENSIGLSVNAHRAQSRAQTADRAAQRQPRLQTAENAGYSEQQLSPQSGWGEAGSPQPD